MNAQSHFAVRRPKGRFTAAQGLLIGGRPQGCGVS
jgi:hypothetical protein